MENFVYYLHIGAFTLSCILTFIFGLYNFKKSIFTKLLTVLFFVISYGLFINFVAFNGLFVKFPHLSRTGLLCVFLIPVLIYFALEKGILMRKWHKIDSLHFIPALLYVINYVPYYILSSEEKLLFIQRESIGSFKEGFIPAYFLPLLAILANVLYLIRVIYLLPKFKKSIKSKFYLIFVYINIGYLLLNNIPVILALLMYYDNNNFLAVLPVFYAISNLGFILNYLAIPEWRFNNALKKERKNIPNENKKRNDLENKFIQKLAPKKILLNDEESKILEDFIRLTESEKRYCKPQFTQKIIAEELGISEYKLRITLEKSYEMKFSDYANYRRIYYGLVEYRKNPAWKKYTTAAIANKIGYNSMNSFHLNFKKYTGLTPKEFFNEI
jgi:AraC-like DNA-binding protein